MNEIEKLNQELKAKLAAKKEDGKELPKFSPGDTVRVNVKVVEGTRERIQAYEGVCISRKGGDGIDASFTVRKISYGEGVERVFPLHSPRIDSIELVRRGDVRRAKLYYLRSRRGKSARIAERTDGHGIEEAADLKAKKADKAKKPSKKNDSNGDEAKAAAANG